ncbi:MAG: FAD-dependent oxidoreductase [Deltaproteobacteria bacterium RIFCSPHIGHO2_12_FULL_43_9]|nr:MAG: FAD-dependent oxidoreductase [Deltaproteobacteria bacterium RIFCSPHIGHO2_12_FULL_43_9]
MKKFDFIIIGGGIIGLFIARELKNRFPSQKIAILEKEKDVSLHASGRNSGVLHAGFYYTADSFKAQFTRDGNMFFRNFCKENKLSINHCGKLVIATNESEVAGLYELKKRGDNNGIDLAWVDEGEINEIDPNAKSYGKGLYSKNTATIDPTQISQFLKRELRAKGVDFYLDTQFRNYKNGLIETNKGNFSAGYIINSSGLYADKIARKFGLSQNYVLIPFKVIYLKHTGKEKPVKTNIYPVPNLANPFLGVHFTVTVDGTVKIGPTAIPAFWRENYKGLSRFKISEFFETIGYESKLFCANSFGFRRLALEEIKKYKRSHLINLASKMVKALDPKGFAEWSRPGIRAQLLDIRTLKLVQDFVFESDDKSFHLLNAVSPAFTCAEPISRFVVEKIGGQTSL